jgi:hypothetical protein
LIDHLIRAYLQYLQIKSFRLPPDIEVSEQFLKLDMPQQWISEWDLELLAREVIINCGAESIKGKSLRKWDTLSGILNSIKQLENDIYAGSARVRMSSLRSFCDERLSHRAQAQAAGRPTGYKAQQRRRRCRRRR